MCKIGWMGYCLNRSQFSAILAGSAHACCGIAAHFCCKFSADLLLAKRKSRGFPPRTARFRRRFAADAARSPGWPGFPDFDELQAAAWKRPFHSPPRPRQKWIAEATVAAV